MKLFSNFFFIIVFFGVSLFILISPQAIQAAEGDTVLKKCDYPALEPVSFNCTSSTTYDKKTIKFPAGIRGSSKEPFSCPANSHCVDLGYMCEEINPASAGGIKCVEDAGNSTPPPKGREEYPTYSPAPSSSSDTTGKQCYGLDSYCSNGQVCAGRDFQGVSICVTPNSLPNGAACNRGAACSNTGYCDSSTHTCGYGSASPAPSADNSCIDYDPGFNNSDGTFSCLNPGETCSSKGLTPYDKTSYNKCSTGGACCYDTAKYSARKLQSTGTGNPGGGTVPPASTTTAPGQGSPAQSSDMCSAEGKGNLDTAFSKQPAGYWGATCGGSFIGQTDPKTAVKGRQYADRYKCTQTGADGHNYVDVKFSSPSDPENPCDKYPWIDTSVTPVCRAGVGGAVVNCADVYKDPSYTCTFDYNSSNTQNKDTLTHCCPDNKRFCDVSGTCVDEGQGCYAKLSLQDVCIEKNDTDCADYAAGARCLDPDGDKIFHCLYPPGTPTPTPTAGVAKNCQVGFKGTGCACDGNNKDACGCDASHNAEPSLDDPTKYYCMPFPSTGMKWCSVTKSAMPANTDPAVCKGSTPYSTPTPISKGCPNDGNHLCVADSGQSSCVAGFGPSNDTVANTACAGWNPETPLCYTRGAKPLASCTITITPSITPSTSPTPTTKLTPEPNGCPIANGDGRVNSCQLKCEGSYPNPRTVGDADCVAAYGTVRGACCTSK